jgi:hypothetical protein
MSHSVTFKFIITLLGTPTLPLYPYLARSYPRFDNPSSQTPTWSRFISFINSSTSTLVILFILALINLYLALFRSYSPELL